jgi:hypothetical protein
VTFILTVIAGLIVVPVALYLAGTGPSAVATTNLTTTSSARASTAQTASPVRSISPTPSHS